MNSVPSGFRSIGGEYAERVERCRQTFFEIFGGYGYQILIPSTVQTFGSCWDRLSGRARSRMISLGAPSGETCCLRPDMTLAALAHISSHHAPEERPLRICYGDRVFRTPMPPDMDVENFQLGAELLGWEGQGADIEVMTLLLRSMDALEIKNSFIVIGDVTILSVLLRNVPEHTASALRNTLGIQSFTGYREVMSRASLPEELRSPLNALPSLRGGLEILESASRVLPPECSLEAIGSLVKALHSAGYQDRILVDLSLARELDYYSGPVFEIFCEGHGKPVGGGGRYDGLLSSFGIIGQAAGFSLDLDQILKQRPEPKGERGCVMAWSGSIEPEKAMQRAKGFSDRRIPVEMSWMKQRSKSIDLARQRGYKWWTDLSDDYVYDLGDNSRKTIEEFWSCGARYA